MKRIFRKIVQLARAAVVILVVITLSLNGAGAAKRLFVAYNDQSEVTKLVFEAAPLKPCPAAGEEAAGNMARGRRPYCEQPAYFATPFILKSDNNVNRHKIVSNEQKLINDPSLKSADKSSIKTSAFLVSSGLGFQFTLVGAKPSGTS